MTPINKLGFSKFRLFIAGLMLLFMYAMYKLHSHLTYKNDYEFKQYVYNDIDFTKYFSKKELAPITKPNISLRGSYVQEPEALLKELTALAKLDQSVLRDVFGHMNLIFKTPAELRTEFNAAWISEANKEVRENLKDVYPPIPLIFSNMQALATIKQEDTHRALEDAMTLIRTHKIPTWTQGGNSLGVMYNAFFEKRLRETGYFDLESCKQFKLSDVIAYLDYIGLLTQQKLDNARPGL